VLTMMREGNVSYCNNKVLYTKKGTHNAKGRDQEGRLAATPNEASLSRGRVMSGTSMSKGGMSNLHYRLTSSKGKFRYLKKKKTGKRYSLPSSCYLLGGEKKKGRK